MAVLNGTIISGGYYATPAGAKRLTITLDVAVGAAATAQVGGASKSIDHTAPRDVTNAEGRACTITVDDGTGQITAISIT